MDNKQDRRMNRGTAGGKKTAPDCNTCTFYDYDEEYDEYYCRVNMDQDDLAHLGISSRAVCPYYRLYDEYKSVRKQN